MKKRTTNFKNKSNTKKALCRLKYKRGSSAGMFYTSSAGAVTSLIFARKNGISTTTSLILVVALSANTTLVAITHRHITSDNIFTMRFIIDPPLRSGKLEQEV